MKSKGVVVGLVAVAMIVSGIVGYSIGINHLAQNQEASIYGISTGKTLAAAHSADVNLPGMSPTDPSYQSWIFTRRMCWGLGGTVEVTGWFSWNCNFDSIAVHGGRLPALIKSVQDVVSTSSTVPAATK